MIFFFKRIIHFCFAHTNDELINNKTSYFLQIYFLVEKKYIKVGILDPSNETDSQAND